MKRSLLTALMVCLALSACDDDGTSSRNAAPSPEASYTAAGSGHSAGKAGQAQEIDSDKRTLAYTHRTEIQTDKEHVGNVVEGIASFCRSENGCLVLNTSIRENDYRSDGMFEARATPEVVRKLDGWLDDAPGKAEILSRSTSAEDLAGPLTDLDRRLSMLYRQRAQLERLQDEASQDIGSLIQISQQLAMVQSNIEAAEGQGRHLRDRVEQEVWHLTVRSRNSVGSTVRPIQDAFSDAPRDLAHGTALLVSAIAYAAPWILVGIVLRFVFLRIRAARRRRREV